MHRRPLTQRSNNQTNQYDCAGANANYCASGSLEGDIIIRCNGSSVGQPGRCTDNLAGEPPLGVNAALCWQSSDTAGDAACEKDCIVYPEQSGRQPFSLTGGNCPSNATNNGTTASSAPFVPSTSAAATTVPPYPTNTTGTLGPGPTSPYPTNTTGTGMPVPPTGTSTASPVPTAGASHNGIAALAVAGIVAAYFF